MLNCSVFAIPTADYTWRRDGLTLTLDGVRLATDNGSLILSELYRNDSGSYECTASNLYGEVTSQPALLTVLGKCVCGGTPTHSPPPHRSSTTPHGDTEGDRIIMVVLVLGSTPTHTASSGQLSPPL